MSEEARNKEIFAEVCRRWDASKGGGVQHWMDAFASDIKFSSLAAGHSAAAFTTARSNKDQAKLFFDGLTKEWTMVHYTMREYIAEGDRVVAIGSMAWINKTTGKTLESPKVDVVRFKDGKIVEFSEYYDTAKVVESATR